MTPSTHALPLPATPFLPPLLFAALISGLMFEPSATLGSVLVAVALMLCTLFIVWRLRAERKNLLTSVSQVLNHLAYIRGRLDGLHAASFDAPVPLPITVKVPWTPAMGDRRRSAVEGTPSPSPSSSTSPSPSEQKA